MEKYKEFAREVSGKETRSIRKGGFLVVWGTNHLAIEKISGLAILGRALIAWGLHARRSGDNLSCVILGQ